MTLDQTITLLKYNNKHISDLKNDDLQQIAEWLEDLKAYKSDDFTKKKLIQVPVPVGEKVWHLNGKFVLEYTVTGYSVDYTGAWLMFLEYFHEETGNTYSSNIETDQIGVKVFLSKEEAEKQVKE